MIENKPLYVAVAQKKEDRRARLQVWSFFYFSSYAFSNALLAVVHSIIYDLDDDAFWNSIFFM